MHIGFVVYGALDTLSGGYLYDRKLVEYLRSQGDTVDVISLPWRNYAAHLTDNLHFRLPKPNVIARSVQSPTKQSPNNMSFDILIQDELNHPSLVLANRGEHPYPVISLVHHLRCSELRPKWQNAFYRTIEKKYLQSVDGFIFNSRTTGRVVDNLLVERKPSIIAYPPADRFGGPISEQEIISRAWSNPLRILFLGNVIYRKGLHTLLKTVSIQPSAFKVDVVGALNSEPVYAKQMQEFVEDNGLSSHITFHSSLDKEPLVEKFRQSHVLVVPSSYEGFGMVYLEGMCFGLPAIGTTAGAAAEIITDGVDGFLIEPGDVDILASRLKLLNEDREFLIRMSLAARERYLCQPKWGQTASRIREFLLKRIDGFPV
ncbi:MAG TPA: glycosyltransferase family 4 protein [Anaerolineales bacterium]|nr:glycosyltransferase family 4 protein [Anaerolineales bacterium]